MKAPPGAALFFALPSPGPHFKLKPRQSPGGSFAPAYLEMSRTSRDERNKAEKEGQERKMSGKAGKPKKQKEPHRFDGVEEAFLPAH